MVARVNQGYEHFTVMREGDGQSHWGIHFRLHERLPTRGSPPPLSHQEARLHPAAEPLGEPTHQVLTVSDQEI